MAPDTAASDDENTELDLDYTGWNRPTTTAALVCSICPWIGEEGRPPTPALTIINGHAVCKEHMRAAHLAQDHRQAVVLGGGSL